MVNIIPRKAKRITASFLAVCVFAMAVLPYGNISFANTSEDNTSTSSGSQETSIDITIPANEKLVIGTEKGIITSVDEPVTEEPTIEEPTTGEPTTDEPTPGEPTPEEPTPEEPATREPTTDEPAPEEPTPGEPTPEEPTPEEPTPGEPTPEGPTTGEPTTGEPTTDEPTTGEPTTEEPTPEEPTPEEPTPEEPTTGEPATEEPTPEEPTPGEPATEEPTPEEPTPEEPTTEEPTPEESTTGEPTTGEPTTEEPITEESGRGNLTIGLPANRLLSTYSVNALAASSNDPLMENFVAKVLRNNEEISTGYAKPGDIIVLEYTATGCSDALKAIFDGTEYVLKDLTETSEITIKDLGENKYSISKTLESEDSAGLISFRFEDGNMIWNADTNVTYDNSLPTIAISIEYGNLATSVATINGTPRDNNDIADVSIYKDETWNSISGFKNNETFEYAINVKGTYKIRVIDVAGNSIEKDVVIESGNQGMIVKRLPNKTTYLKNEEISLEGGYLKITNTFNETITGDANEILMCFCEDGCDCAVDGVCDPSNGCLNSDYVIPMNLATIVAIEEINTEGIETTKKVTLAYDIYKPTFEIIEQDIKKYNIEMTPNSGELTDGDEIEIIVNIDKVTPEVPEIVEKYYAWSTLPNNPGSEIYTASFVGPIQEEIIGDDEDPEAVQEDGVFKYSNILDENHRNVDNGNHWEYRDEMYRSGNISYGKDATSSQKRITIENVDENGIISFEYMTNSPAGDIMTVTINGEEVLRRDGKYSWQTFSKKFSAVDGKYVIDLNFSRSGVTSGSSSNYVAIRNLTFTGAKKWYPLAGNSVRLNGETVVGKNNYLYIKTVNENDETAIEYSGNFEYQSILRSISIETVPNNTVYYVLKDETDPTKYKKSTSSIVTGGEITLWYDKGNSKIPMAVSDGLGGEVLNSNVSVVARPLKDSADGELSSATWNNYIDLRYPGVWDVKVSYSEDGIITLYDYYTITVNYNQTDGIAIINARDTLVNEPDIVEGMIPVKWIEVDRETVEVIGGAEELTTSTENITERFWITTTEYDTEWYDYASSSKQWANIMLMDDIVIREVIEPKDSKWTLNNLAGKRIDNCGSMFVWIPRFSYDVDDFDYRVYNVEWSDEVNDTLSNSVSAFTYQDKELMGFWMGKYEASEGSAALAVKPYVDSNFWSNSSGVYDGITVDEAYEYSKNMLEVDYNEYGITGTALSHLVTMAEWDAISILAMSDEGYAIPAGRNEFFNAGSSYTGYNSAKKPANSNNTADSSTTYNMTGVFDMHGGANEIVSAYIGNTITDKPDIDVLTLTDVDDPDYIIDDIERMNKWLLGKIIRYFYEEEWFNVAPDADGIWTNLIYENSDFENDFIMFTNADIVMRGGDSVQPSPSNGMFSTWMMPYSYYDGVPNPIGFRPSILITEKTNYEEPEITVTKLDVKTYKDGNLVDKNNVYAGVGDVIQLTLKLDKDQMNISDILINNKAPSSSVPELSSESSAQEWILTYKVEEGDNNGKVEISYKYRIQGQSEWKDGPNNVNTVYVDTTSSNANIGLSEDKKKIEITVISSGEGDSGIKIIKVEKRGEGEEAPGSDFFGEGGEEVDLGDGGKGTVDITGTGKYYIYIEDEAGNIIIKEVGISSGSGEGEFEINDIIPKLENLVISVFNGSDYITDVEYVKRLDTIKVDMTFDQLLTVGPTVYILGEKAVVSGDENDKTLWTAICNRVGSKYAYDDIPITISDYEYHGNKGNVVFETFDDANGVIIPYDGSLVKISVSEPTLFNKNGENWEVVSNLESGKDIALEYVATFNDPLYTRDNIARPETSNLNESSINILPSNITVTTEGMTANISVSAFSDPDTGSEVPEKRIIRFENVVGEGRFGFSISGAKYSDDLSSFTNYVAQDIYGNPNELFTTSGSGDANTPMIDTRPPSLNNVSVYSDNENIQYAKNGDTITVKFAASESLSVLPTVTIFGNEVEVNYVDGSYVAQYLIPNVAEYTQGIVPFSISNYKDNAGNVGNAFTQDDLNSFENVIYDITAPVVAIDPNGGDFTDTTVAVTLTDSPAGIKDTILRYYWNTESTEPEIAENDWSLAAISGNNAIISSPTGLNESRYLIIAGVKDNSGNESPTFISNEFIFSNAYEVITTTSPDTFIDDSDPENVIITPGVVTGGGEYNPGESVTITATPTDGYRFDKWVINGADGFTDLTLPEQSFTMPMSNVWASANFVKLWTVVFKSYDGEILSTQVVDNGSAAVAPDAPPRTGYSFTGWEPTPSEANFLNVSCDMELVATYSRKTYTITAYAGSNGTISPAGSVSVSYGDNKRFNISPNNGYKILDVIVDGVSVGAVNTYLFEDVTSNHTIHVTFTEDVRYELEGEWYYDNIELVADSPEYVFRSRETLDSEEDASAIVTVRTSNTVNVSFEYILNARDDAMFGFTINGKPLMRVIESSDTWTEFNETIEPVDGKIVIGLTYSKGENPTETESFLDLAAIKNLEVE